ncbi:cell division protein kinase 2, putative [Entamoeba histolytica HM-1:IMSS-B]|uniref:cyclin-dependent kinase n=2 Tax=Entamoeba histolytica (strain ATCC 30459 / HM-1:IMSS / ABRM) TaxID=294381 RepID=M3UP93_ENTH1|nr:cell division protein kinase 2, putative [Entamoeba histolytica HM-1:IMSS-B]ENY62125.1 cyclin-dependent kinase A-1, putative [Entamoeba histolytica HM-1:IMSS-A]
MEEEPIISDIYYEIQNRRFKKDGIKLGGGSYGEVTLRTDGVTNKKVAVKQFNLGDQSLMGRDFDGYPLEILREIKVLRELDHKMARGEILFAGNDSQILESIYVILGTPNSGPSSEWVGVEKLQGYIKPLQEISINSLSRYVPNLDNEGNLLIHKMLRYNPNKRISCERALKHPYFQQLTMDQSN